MTTAIPWCDETWPLVTGCSKVSEGCDHCWACRLAATRLKHNPRYAGLTTDYHGVRHTYNWTGEVRLHRDLLDKPLHWKKPRRVFVCPTSDLFHEKVPDDFLRDVFRWMRYYNRHTFILLTKRPDRMRRFLETWWPWSRRQNIWYGVSVENQEQADKRIPILLSIPAAVRVVCIEPCLSAVDLTPYLNCGMMQADHTRRYSSERSGDDVHGSDSNGGIQDRLRWASMEAQETLRQSGGESLRGDNQTNGDSRRDIGISGSPSRDVHGQSQEVRGLCSPNGLGLSQSTGDTPGLRSQSQRREPQEQSSEQLGTCDEAGKLPPRREDVRGSWQEGATRREKHERQIECAASNGDTAHVGTQGDDPVGNGQPLRGVAEDDRRHLHDQNVEAPANLDWVILGCESGPNRRPFKEDWARSIRDECIAARVPFYFKQTVRNGKVVHMPELDGVVWAQYPVKG